MAVTNNQREREANYLQRHSRALITVHWLMAVLLVFVFGCIELRELYPKGSEPRETLKTFHFMAGLTVFLLVWIRLAIRVKTRYPPTLPTIGLWQHRIAMAIHALMYLLMIAMPIAGWAVLSAEGKVIPFWGIQLPAIVGENKELAHTIEALHETAGLVAYYLIGLHVLAALSHHYILKNNLLIRMIPMLKKKRTDTL